MQQTRYFLCRVWTVCSCPSYRLFLATLRASPPTHDHKLLRRCSKGYSAHRHGVQREQPNCDCNEIKTLFGVEEIEHLDDIASARQSSRHCLEFYPHGLLTDA